MLELQDLVQVKTQLVYLTATMQPSKEREFLQLIELPLKEQC
jgi:hypothetical protein